MDEIADKFVLAIELLEVTKLQSLSADQYDLKNPIVDLGFIFEEFRNELIYHVKLKAKEQKFVDLRGFMPRGEQE